MPWQIKVDTEMKYRISLIIRQNFSFQNNPKDLDLSCKTDLDCLGRVKIGIIAKFHKTDLVISSHSIGTKPPSYSRINTVCPCRPELILNGVCPCRPELILKWCMPLQIGVHTEVAYALADQS